MMLSGPTEMRTFIRQQGRLAVMEDGCMYHFTSCWRPFRGMLWES